ncbi:MAG: prephenate dehydrogenase [Candidatus Omnitrophota bacterium]|nr:prephenate dehydrogenase [Candidatus Omnitrophota bacterium]
MKMFNKVVIFGTGLIGGSLGLALKRKHLVERITGLSRHKKNARKALKIGSIDCIGSSIDAVRDADLVILASPVDSIINIALKIAKGLKKDCVVIDVGSTKENIVTKAGALIPNFVGCHPLAGSEKKGIENARGTIFAGSICIITPSAKTKKNALNKIKLLWRKLGAQVVILTPKKHDQILAFTSHLPHTIAFSLIGSIPDKFLSISSGGLKDTTRISGSNALLWSKIFLSNRKNLLASVSSFQAKLAALKLALENKDMKCLMKILSAAKRKRERLLRLSR